MIKELEDDVCGWYYEHYDESLCYWLYRNVLKRERYSYIFLSKYGKLFIIYDYIHCIVVNLICGILF